MWGKTYGIKKLHRIKIKQTCTNSLQNDDENVDLKLHDIEKMKKCIKNKRCAMDQDFALVKEMAKAIIDVDDEIAAAKDIKIEIKNNDGNVVS